MNGKKFQNFIFCLRYITVFQNTGWVRNVFRAFSLFSSRANKLVHKINASAIAEIKINVSLKNWCVLIIFDRLIRFKYQKYIENQREKLSNSNHIWF